MYETKQNAAADYTQTLGASMVLNARYGLSRVVDDRSAGTGDFMAASLGLPSALDQVANYHVFPSFAIQDMTGPGPAGGDVYRGYKTTHHFIGNLSKVASRHSLKFGFDARVNLVNFGQGNNPAGAFNFTRAMTQGPDPRQAGAASGVGYASFLLGTGADGSLNTTALLALGNRYWALYAQDDFQVSRKLTVNVGLRWELETGVTDRFDRIAAIDPEVRNPLSDKVGMTLTGGYYFAAGGGGLGRRAIREPFGKQFSPRVGLAYTLNSNTVIRAAYGVFYAIPPYSVNSHFTAGYESQTPWTATADGVTPTNLLPNPFPAGFSPVVGSSAGLLTNIGNQLYGGWPESLKSPYNQNWNLTVQRRLGKELMVEVAYAGNKATQLPIVLQRYNVLTPAQMQQYQDKLFEQVANPFYGYIPATAGALSGKTIALGQLLKPDPQYLNRGAYVNATGANANYHALQARFEKRFSSGLSVLSSYTWSKTLTDASGGSGFFDSYWNDIRDWTCIRCDYGLAVHDQPHRLVTSFTYELPIGTGKRLGSGWGRLADLLLGQWQANGIVTFSKGLPLRFNTATNTSYAGVTAGGGNQTPDSTGRNAELGSGKTIDRWFDTTQFTLPARFTFGTLGRVHPNLREDGASHVDLSVFKSFRVSERYRAEFRAEAFNLTNTPLFSGPNTTFGSSSFGRVTGQQNDPRQIQLALRISF